MTLKYFLTHDSMGIPFTTGETVAVTALLIILILMIGVPIVSWVSTTHPILWFYNNILKKKLVEVYYTTHDGTELIDKTDKHLFPLHFSNDDIRRKIGVTFFNTTSILNKTTIDKDVGHGKPDYCTDYYYSGEHRLYEGDKQWKRK